MLLDQARYQSEPYELRFPEHGQHIDAVASAIMWHQEVVDSPETFVTRLSDEIRPESAGVEVYW